MKSKTGKALGGLGILALSVLAGGCATPPIRAVDRNAELAAPVAAAQGPVQDESIHSSQWARVLPAPVVNGEPLAMVEYNPEYARNDAALGVVTGPAGQPLSYYSSPEAPSLYWQYQFTLSQSANTVTVFRRPSDVVYSRPYGGYTRVP